MVSPRKHLYLFDSTDKSWKIVCVCKQWVESLQLPTHLSQACGCHTGVGRSHKEMKDAVRPRSLSSQKDISAGKRVEMRSQGFLDFRNPAEIKIWQGFRFMVKIHGTHPPSLRRWETGQGHEASLGESRQKPLFRSLATSAARNCCLAKHHDSN